MRLTSFIWLTSFFSLKLALAGENDKIGGLIARYTNCSPAIAQTMIGLVETLISYNTRSYGSAMVSGIRPYLFEEGIMKPVVGIDVSKGESEGFIFLERNKSLGKSFRFLHTNDCQQQLKIPRF